ncbi:polysulfide reductase NrfD, partial [bacterium]|nr:polysulfide reductase NrfD [bacterium]
MHNFLVTLKTLLRGNRWYYVWLGLLGVLIVNGLAAYLRQTNTGLIVTGMRDPVSWGFYISNFTFLVGVAAAAVLLVVPAYIYNFKPIKEIVLFGELLAVAAMVMCMLFVMVDMGHPGRYLHLMPIVGSMNFPSSLLSWDILALSGYLAINLFISFYALYRMAHSREYSLQLIKPLILLSIPWAVSIHTVTAFLYNGLSSRPFWNASILAPRFLASAFCSGPAVMILIFQIVRKVSKIEIDNKALFKISELIAYAMGVNLFLFAAEFFKEFYSGSVHLAPMKYLYFGLDGHTQLVPWMWTAFVFNLTAFFIFLNPRARRNFFVLNTACVLVIIGVYIEKGMGLVIPGFVPSTLGEIYDYLPTLTEKSVAIGVWAVGGLIYTLLVKFAMPVYTGAL